MFGRIREWLERFKKVYKSHRIDVEVKEDGTHIILDVALDMPEEEAREIVDKFDEFVRTLAKGKLPINLFFDVKKAEENIKKLARLARKKKRTPSPLLTGVVG